MFDKANGNYSFPASTDTLLTADSPTPTALAALLDPVLADNGGATRTHALLPGSPAINAADPDFVPPPNNDQRGAGFARVYGGRIDIGAFEAQPPRADFDGDLGSTIPNGIGNKLGTGASPIDPLLGVLGDNGGPTFTHALLVGSPAIDMGNLSIADPPDFDQRGTGFERVANGRIDMGAFEVQSAPLMSALTAELVDLAMAANGTDGTNETYVPLSQERIAPQDLRARAVTELGAAPRLVANFGDIAVSRPKYDVLSTAKHSLDEELVLSSL